MTATVVGAGAFGGWTALALQRAGCRATLVDWWGPGNSRSSSGDETRVIRGAYGPNVVYTRMVADSVASWRDVGMLEAVGSLWMAPEGGDAWERASMRNIEACGLKCERLETDELQSRWPHVNWTGIAWTVFEPELGYLHARRFKPIQVQTSTEVVANAVNQQANLNAIPGTVHQQVCDFIAQHITSQQEGAKVQ